MGSKSKVCKRNEVCIASGCIPKSKFHWVMLSENGIEEVLPFNKNAENAAELARRTFMSPGIQQPVEKKNSLVNQAIT